MIRYVAFLRGINVGGKKLIKMDELARAFVSLKFKNVRTYIQSGNVIFDAPAAEPGALIRSIEKKIRTTFGHEVPVALQTSEELAAIIKRNPFKKVAAGDDVVVFVAFLAAAPSIKPKLPLQAMNGALEVLAVKDRAAFIVCRRKPNGLFEFPNNFFEKEFGVTATTRNWNTVNKIVGLMDSSGAA